MGIVIAGMIVCMLTAVGISIQASNKAIDRALQVQREQEAKDAAQEAARAAQSRAASCTFITTVRDAYLADPPKPPSKTYTTVTQAWIDLAKNCE
jgi:hypothetical protein